ncbi:MAG: diacylglycerol/lipid kinase family protein, partial [Flavitalea sp.]
MAKVLLIHNPGAGDEQHGKKDLIKMLEKKGFEYEYISREDDGWKKFDPHADVIAVAGGDGTVRNVVKQLLKKRLEKTPVTIGLIPLGTANNISKSLSIDPKKNNVIKDWDFNKIKQFDIGMVHNIPGNGFFLESFGYGVFPYLMMEMKKREDRDELSPEQSIQTALETLYRIILSYEAKKCRLVVDGTDHSGKFILAEIMNTPSIGPKLCISPLSDPGDHEFEVVLVPEQHKEKFAEYVLGRIKGLDETFSFHTLKGKDISISWEGTHVHIDDETV